MLSPKIRRYAFVFLTVMMTVILIIALTPTNLKNYVFIKNRWYGYYTPTLSWEKVEKKEDIPEKIFANIEMLNKEGHLQRGYWEYNIDFFETDTFYIMICGGEKFTDNYDVTISKFTYEYGGPLSSPNKAMYEDIGYRGLRSVLYIEEDIDSSALDYCEGFQYPFVLFRTTERRALNLTHTMVYVVNELETDSLKKMDNFLK